VVIEPAWIVTRETPLPIVRWPAALGPLRVVAISDLHTGAPHISVDTLHEVVERVNAAHPDLIVLLGDYCVGLAESCAGRYHLRHPRPHQHIDLRRSGQVLRDPAGRFLHNIAACAPFLTLRSARPAALSKEPYTRTR
jgi:3',5'-cyclic AMP phosphodiesterase CpdA